MKKVTVIIPIYNMEKYITEAVDSALNQTYENCEIIVIDDGSTDNTFNILKRYNNNIRYIKQDNKGLACARNVGIKKSTGDYIALLDADDIWLPDRLTIEVKILDELPEVGLVHSSIYWINENGKKLTNPDEKRKYCSGYIAKYIISRKSDIYCPTVLFRKSCVNDVGYFDENLTRLGVEDRDLWYRIALKYKIEYVDKPLAKYRYREDSMSKNFNKMQKARYYMINKYFPNKKHKLNLERRKLLSDLHLSQGDGIAWRNNNYIKAIIEYIKAIKYFPFNFIIYYHSLKVLIKKLIKFRKGV